MKITNLHSFAAKTLRAVSLAAALAISAAPMFAEVITDDFNDSNDNGWFHIHPFGPFGISNSFQVVNGEYWLAAPPSPAPQILEAAVAALPNFAQQNWSDFEVSVDFSGWANGPRTNQTIFLAARGSANANGTFNFYALHIIPDDFPAARNTGLNPKASMAIAISVSNVAVVGLAFADLPAPLDPTRWYRAVFAGQGNVLIGRFYERDNLVTPIAETWGYDFGPQPAPSGFVGLIASDRAPAIGVANNGVRVKFDNFRATDVPSAENLRCPAPTNSFRISDDFSDGNDQGWTRINPFGNVTIGVNNGMYRLAAPASPAPSILPALAMALRPEVDWVEFDLRVDFSGWLFSPTNDTYVMLNARQSQNPDGTFNFYSLRVVPNATTLTNQVLSPTATLAIDAWTNNVRYTLNNQRIPDLDPAQWYRLVFLGRGDLLEGPLYAVTNLEAPIVKFSVAALPEPRLQHGAVSLLALDRLGANGAGNGAVSVLFDNFAGWGLELPPPLTIERAVILSWPAGNTNVFLETAAKVTGPWSTLSVIPTTENGTNVVALRTSATMQYFRLVRQ